MKRRSAMQEAAERAELNQEGEGTEFMIFGKRLDLKDGSLQSVMRCHGNGRGGFTCTLFDDLVGGELVNPRTEIRNTEFGVLDIINLKEPPKAIQPFPEGRVIGPRGVAVDKVRLRFDPKQAGPDHLIREQDLPRTGLKVHGEAGDGLNPVLVCEEPFRRTETRRTIFPGGEVSPGFKCTYYSNTENGMGTMPRLTIQTQGFSQLKITSLGPFPEGKIAVEIGGEIKDTGKWITLDL